MKINHETSLKILLHFFFITKLSWELFLPVNIPSLSLCFGPKFGIFNVHLKVGLVKEQRMAQINEKEGGTVVELTNPVDDRIGYPKSKSNTRTTIEQILPQ